MHTLVDLDTRRILEFCLADMNNGDAAQLPEPVAEIVADSVSKGAGAGLPDRSRAVTDSRLPGVDAPEDASDAAECGGGCRHSSGAHGQGAGGEGHQRGAAGGRRLRCPVHVLAPEVIRHSQDQG